MVMAMEKKRKRSVGGILSVMVLLSMTLLMEAGPTGCPPAVGSAVGSLSAVLDLQQAELSQRQHLEALFHR